MNDHNYWPETVDFQGTLILLLQTLDFKKSTNTLEADVFLKHDYYIYFLELLSLFYSCSLKW